MLLHASYHLFMHVNISESDIHLCYVVNSMPNASLLFDRVSLCSYISMKPGQSERTRDFIKFQVGTSVLFVILSYEFACSWFIPSAIVWNKWNETNSIDTVRDTSEGPYTIWQYRTFQETRGLPADRAPLTGHRSNEVSCPEFADGSQSQTDTVRHHADIKTVLRKPERQTQTREGNSLDVTLTSKSN